MNNGKKHFVGKLLMRSTLQCYWIPPLEPRWQVAALCRQDSPEMARGIFKDKERI